jgi:hypothetical protein
MKPDISLAPKSGHFYLLTTTRLPAEADLKLSFHLIAYPRQDL